MKSIKNIIIYTVLMSGSFSCKKFVAVDAPVNRLVSDRIFEDDITANSAMAGLYSSMIANIGMLYGGLGGFNYIASLSSDDLVNYSVFSTNMQQFYENAIVPSNPNISTLWNSSYNFIYQANALIEGLNKSTLVSQQNRIQFIAEAKFIRACLHFYLVNTYGEVPYITGTDYRVNTLAKRQPVSGVYDLIIKDLTEAKIDLQENYSFSLDERIRVNKYAAGAMLARAYLYMEEWEKAELESSEVIQRNDMYWLVPELNGVFVKNSPETIWQLQTVFDYTDEGELYINPNNDGNAGLSDDLVNSFAPDDNRRLEWITVNTVSNNVPYKYREYGGASSGAEYSMVLRLAEQYLIRAEARARQNKLVGVNSAQEDIDMIRDRAGLSGTTAATKEQLLEAIANERRWELFTESGHRWFDLKRTRKAAEVLPILKSTWTDKAILFPIPEKEVLVNPNMTQNEGY